MIDFTLLLTLLVAYISGAIPYAVVLGKIFYKVDPRTLGDGNPGTSNAFRLGGAKLGVSILLLDFLKALIPVAVAKWALGFEGWQLFGVAVLPTVGHAYSIFLRGAGGKAIVTLFGVWTGLTLFVVPCVMGIVAIASLYLVKQDDLRALLLPISALIFLLVLQSPLWMITLSVAQVLILSSKIMISKSYQRQK